MAPPTWPPKKIDRACRKCGLHALHWLVTLSVKPGRPRPVYLAVCRSCGHEWAVRLTDQDRPIK